MRYDVRTEWRYKGQDNWQVGFPVKVNDHGLLRMPLRVYGFGGPLVRIEDIEYKQ